MSRMSMWIGELMEARVTVAAALELYERGVIDKEVLAHYLWLGGAA
jgi:uncharacterized protein (DUF433 family)